MRIRLVGLAAVALLALTVAPAARAQTTDTQTNCSIYGNTANCNSTSTTTPTPAAPDPDAWRKAGEGMGSSIGTVIAANRAMKQAKAGVETRVVYCQQNPEGSVTVDTGEHKTCADELAYLKAACTVAKDKRYKSICVDTRFTWGKPKAVKP